MILRFLVKFLLLAIIVSGIVLFGSQWKLEKSLNQFIASVKSQADIKYESAKIDFSGEITINGVKVYHPVFEELFEASQIKVYRGSLYETLFSKFSFSSSELPDNAHIIFKNALISFKSPNWLKGPLPPATSYDILESSYCGSIKRFSMKEIQGMGYDYLAFAGEINYQLDRYSGSAIVKGFFDVDNLAKAQYQINVGNLMAWQESLSARAVGQAKSDQVIPMFELFDLTYQDQGYNDRKARYCSMKENIEMADYYTGHIKVVDELMMQVGVKLTEGFKTSYLQMIKPNTQSHWYFQPKPNFEFSSFDAYHFDDFIELSGLQLKVNDAPVKAFIETGSFKEIAKIPDLVKQQEADERKLKENEIYVTTKEYQSVSSSRVGRFVDYPIKVELKDGFFYEGRLTRTSNSQIWVTVRRHGGEVNMPINLSNIKSMQVEVTVKKKKVFGEEEKS